MHEKKVSNQAHCKLQVEMRELPIRHIIFLHLWSYDNTFVYTQKSPVEMQKVAIGYHNNKN